MSYVTLNTAKVEKPSDATHFCPETDEDYAMYYKKVGGSWHGKSAQNPDDKWSKNVCVDDDTEKHMVEI